MDHSKRPLQNTDVGEEKFIWVKKQKLDEAKGLSREEIERIEAERRERNRRELEKLERQRLQWEAEKEQRQREKEVLQFGKEAELLGDWQEKERKFHLDQALAKADLRVNAGRGAPLDWLLLNTTQNSDLELVFVGDPLLVVDELDQDERQDLLKELDSHRELVKDSEALQYIDSLISCIQEESGVSDDFRHIAAVKDDIQALLCGKTAAELTKLERSILVKLAGPGPVDTEYWEGLLTHLRHYRRIALVMETNAVLVDRRKGQLGEKARLLDSEDRKGLFATPRLGQIPEFPPTPSPVQVYTDDSWDQDPESIALYRAEAEQKVSKDELPFNTEAEDIIQAEGYLHHGLVKPRFFNRVRTFYDWNKYNQMHYDSDNPPPKTIQGYRFNIFYPQLASLQLAASLAGRPIPGPTYTLEEDPSNPDMRIVRFRAGPPYQDVAFRIIAEDWDMSHRHGFKCSFEGWFQVVPVNLTMSGLMLQQKNQVLLVAADYLHQSSISSDQALNQLAQAVNIDLEVVKAYLEELYDLEALFARTAPASDSAASTIKSSPVKAQPTPADQSPGRNPANVFDEHLADPMDSQTQFDIPVAPVDEPSETIEGEEEDDESDSPPARSKRSSIGTSTEVLVTPVKKMRRR